MKSIRVQSTSLEMEVWIYPLRALDKLDKFFSLKSGLCSLLVTQLLASFSGPLTDQVNQAANIYISTMKAP